MTRRGSWWRTVSAMASSRRHAAEQAVETFEAAGLTQWPALLQDIHWPSSDTGSGDCELR